MKFYHIGFLCVPLLLLASCFGIGDGNHTQKIISIATEVDQQVEGGMTVNTVKLGEVHLSPALFKVSIPPGVECEFYDITFPEISEDPSLYIPWQLFGSHSGIGGQKIKDGMTEVEIRNNSKSPHLEPGGIVFLVIQNNMNKIVHRLMIGDQYDPHHFFIQNNWISQESRFDGMYVMREVRERSEEGNPAATEFKSAMNPGEVVYAGPKLFEVSRKRSEARVGKVLRMGFVEPKSLVAEDLNFQGEPVFIIWDPSTTLRKPSKSQLDIDKKAAEIALVEEVLIWSSPPGLTFKLSPELKAVDLKNDLRSLGNYSFTWTSIEVGKSGVSVSGGSL
ncbi:MAG: hypothetical protein P8R38_06065 [Planctomycetota bacterium]|nr:hypothetical protein [Planctomycetota bacterium]MDG2084501.1 hypothetical protein [Planctomycetota bacterium]